MIFSLVIATYGRKNELRDMLNSLRSSCYDINKLEVIIIDQNDKYFLNNILVEFDDINIKYIHSDVKGLSYNRNIGLKHASGDFICFPDDDCKFYENTFTEVLYALSDKNIDFCIGRIYDRSLNKDIIKKWPKKRLNVNKLNFYFINSSITLFIKRGSILNFDENLGVGSKFGSCEDADLIYRILENNANGVYTPKIELWHPEPNYNETSFGKIESYAAGFGYFVRKDMDTIKIVLLLLLIGKKILNFFLSNFSNKKFNNKIFKVFFSGLLNGLKH
jgi:glycosyltransferase involved in cell wall biosynthesis